MATTPTDIGSEEAAASWLYGLAPESFVENRNQLVKELRAGSRRDLAALVALLRRPTVVAGELNRVLRADPVRLEAVLDTALDVRDGHQDLLDGDSVDISSLQRAHRQAAMDLADLAERNHSEILVILESASLDESLHERMRAATFAVEPAPQTGFDLLTPTATVTSLSDARAKRDARTAAAEAAQDATARKRRSGKGRPANDGAAPAAVDQADTNADDAPPVDSESSDAAAAARAAAEELAATAAAEEVAAATKARELAGRRLVVAEKSRVKAEERVAKMETQLGAAREHLGDAEAKQAAAEAAVARTQERLDQATTESPD